MARSTPGRLRLAPETSAVVLPVRRPRRLLRRFAVAADGVSVDAAAVVAVAVRAAAIGSDVR